MKTTYLIDENIIDEKSRIELDRLEKDSNISELFIFPDFHYSSKDSIPVGTAFSSDKIYPLVSGKDIGCGVAYLKISKNDVIKPFNKHKHYKAFYNAHLHMTDEGLGSGNHFLSLEEDSNNLYIIVHTGTRNRGIAFYQKLYKVLNEYNYINKTDTEFIDRETFKPLEKEYNELLQYSTNRRLQFLDETLTFLQVNRYIKNIVKTEIGDSIHNYIEIKGDIVIHRKGATGLNGTIVMPLSMTRGSLLVTSNYDYALNSCGHGAGRKLSRTETIKYWNNTLKKKDRQRYKEELVEMLNRNGEFDNAYIQEMDFAYKDTTDILKNQPHIRKVTETKPICTIKFNI